MSRAEAGWACAEAGGVSPRPSSEGQGQGEPTADPATPTESETVEAWKDEKFRLNTFFLSLTHPS